MRIQPIDSILSDVPKAPVLKSRLKRLFDRPFNGVLRISSAGGGEKDSGSAEFEPSTVCLDKMVQNFIEDNNEKKCGRNRCNCFNGNSNDSSDDELDFFSDSLSANSSFSDPSDTLKALIPCASVSERNLLADTSKIIEKNKKTCRRKDDLRKIVTDGLADLGYNASACKSKWEKSSSIPAGEYEYIDVIIDGERLLIDVDFRSEFEIARSTSGYKAILQHLPYIFVGKADRLLQIVSIASEAARLSLKKKGMHVPPWRKIDYLKSKWLAPHTRISPPKSNLSEMDPQPEPKPEPVTVSESVSGPKPEPEDDMVGGLDLIFREEDVEENKGEKPSPPATPMTWQLPPVRPKSLERGNKQPVTGLASLLK